MSCYYQDEEVSYNHLKFGNYYSIYTENGEMVQDAIEYFRKSDTHYYFGGANEFTVVFKIPIEEMDDYIFCYDTELNTEHYVNLTKRKIDNDSEDEEEHEDKEEYIPKKPRVVQKILTSTPSFTQIEKTQILPLTPTQNLSQTQILSPPITPSQIVNTPFRFGKSRKSVSRKPRKSVSRKSASRKPRSSPRKSVSRKSVSRKSASRKPRSSPRKSVSRKSVSRKSVSRKPRSSSRKSASRKPRSSPRKSASRKPRETKSVYQRIISKALETDGPSTLRQIIKSQGVPETKKTYVIDAIKKMIENRIVKVIEHTSRITKYMDNKYALL
jgi:hypothetical protein